MSNTLKDDFLPFEPDAMDWATEYDKGLGEAPGETKTLAALITAQTAVNNTEEQSAGFKPPFTDESLALELAGHAERMDKNNINVQRDELLEKLEFKVVKNIHYEPNLSLNTFSKKITEKVNDKITEKITFYKERHAAKKLESGKHEAAEWGYGKVNGKDVIVFSLDFAFMGGSLNPVVAALHKEAADEAIRKKIPLVSDYRTGGARQEENASALFMMPEITADIERVKRAGLLTVCIAETQTWGGIPASAMPRNNFIIAYEGGGLGFAGARVGDKSRDSRHQTGIPPHVAQRAETHAIKRNVEFLAQDHDEAIDILSDLIDNVDPKKNRRKKFVRPELDAEPGRELPISGRHIQSAHLGRRKLAAINTIHQEPREYDPDDPMDLYRRISFDPTILDTDTLITSLESPTLLYNRYRDEAGNIIYPKIISGLGKIAGQTFLIIGHQPSFVLDGKPGEESFRRYSSVPTPHDFNIGLRHIAYAASKKYPIITYADTFGAEASVEAELYQQFRDISDYQDAYRNHPKPVYSVGLMIGSGGGLTMASRDDYLGLLEGSHTMVAEAYSSAAITFNISDREPTQDEVIHTLGALNPYAQQQVDLGIADEVIKNYPSPLETAYEVQETVYELHKELGKLSTSKLFKRREERSKKLISGLIVPSASTT